MLLAKSNPYLLQAKERALAWAPHILLGCKVVQLVASLLALLLGKIIGRPRSHVDFLPTNNGLDINKA